MNVSPQRLFPPPCFVPQQQPQQQVVVIQAASPTLPTKLRKNTAEMELTDFTIKLLWITVILWVILQILKTASVKGVKLRTMGEDLVKLVKAYFHEMTKEKKKKNKEHLKPPKTIDFMENIGGNKLETIQMRKSTNPYCDHVGLIPFPQIYTGNSDASIVPVMKNEGFYFGDVEKITDQIFISSYFERFAEDPHFSRKLKRRWRTWLSICKDHSTGYIFRVGHFNCITGITSTCLNFPLLVKEAKMKIISRICINTEKSLFYIFDILDGHLTVQIFGHKYNNGNNNRVDRILFNDCTSTALKIHIKDVIKIPIWSIENCQFASTDCTFLIQVAIAAGANGYKKQSIIQTTFLHIAIKRNSGGTQMQILREIGYRCDPKVLLPQLYLPPKSTQLFSIFMGNCIKPPDHWKKSGKMKIKSLSINWKSLNDDQLPLFNKTTNFQSKSNLEQHIYLPRAIDQLQLVSMFGKCMLFFVNADGLMQFLIIKLASKRKRQEIREIRLCTLTFTDLNFEKPVLHSRSTIAFQTTNAIKLWNWEATMRKVCEYCGKLSKRLLADDAKTRMSRSSHFNCKICKQLNKNGNHQLSTNGTNVGGYFCDEICFHAAWPQHKKLHTLSSSATI